MVHVPHDPDVPDFEAALYSQSLPGAFEHVVEFYDDTEDDPGIAGKQPVDGEAAAYICIGTQCSPAIRHPAALTRALRDARLRP